MEALFLLLLVGLVGWLRVNAKAAKEQQAISENIDRNIDLAMTLQNAIEDLSRILEPHLKILSMKKFQKTYVDDYGRTVDDAFMAEIAYFRNSIVPQHVVAALGPDGVDRAILSGVSRFERIGRGKADARERVKAFCRDKSDLLTLALGCVAPADPSKELLASDFSHVIGLIPDKARVGLSDEEVLQAILDVASPGEPSASAEYIFQEWFTGDQYETFVQKVLEELALKTRTTPKSGDQGIDIIGSVDGVEIGFQCKRCAIPVGNKAVQEVAAGKSFYQLDHAVVVSNNEFTRSARQLATSLQVDLLHHEQLPGWIERLKQ